MFVRAPPSKCAGLRARLKLAGKATSSSFRNQCMREPHCPPKHIGPTFHKSKARHHAGGSLAGGHEGDKEVLQREDSGR